MSDQLVRVRWQDSMSYDRWDTRANIREHLVESNGGLEHVTVGWIIDETDAHIIVASSRHSSEDIWNGAMAIPRSVILETIALEVVRPA